jgi:hypothetical protein
MVERYCMNTAYLETYSPTHLSLLCSSSSSKQEHIRPIIIALLNLFSAGAFQG